MTRKLVSAIYIGVFALCFVIMAAIMVKGLIDQKNDEKRQIERYEKMISKEGKTVLTNEILEEDHDKYISDSEKGKKTFVTLLICFGSVVVMFFIMAFFNMILNRIDGSRREPLILSIVSFAVTMFIFVSLVIVVVKVIVPKLADSDPKDAAYSFCELTIKDRETKKEYVETGAGDSQRTETRITYFLVEENGNKIVITKLLYDRFTGPGTYIAGRTSEGHIFSLYSGDYFKLEK